MESLRLYPLAPGLFKCVHKDTKFGSGFLIPAKTNVIVSYKSATNGRPLLFNTQTLIIALRE